MGSFTIPFNRPCVTGNESLYIAEAIASGQLSGNGAFTRRAERLLQERTGATRALLTPSCTQALEMSALLLGLQPGDEVIVPAFTFVTTANAFASRGATPVFADCDPRTLNVDPRAIEPLVSPRTRAIVVMHYAGIACDMEAIAPMARRAGAALIEDNAHGLFGSYRGRPLGTFGALATQSFHETKNVTCGEGGALLVNDPSLVTRAEILREKGTDRSRFLRGEVDKYTWVDVGSNFLPSELQAAHLCAQLEAAEHIQARRHAIWQRYQDSLAGWARTAGVAQPAVPPGCDHPAHCYFLVMPGAAAQARLIAHLRARGILAVFHYQPLNTSVMGGQFGGRAGQCPVAEDVSQRLVRLPLFADLTESEQDSVLDAVTTSLL